MIGISAAALFGLVLIIASVSLFLTSKFKPELYQESDNIYAVIGIVCGILLVASYDLGAAMAFQQMLMIGSLITIMWQFIQVRAENKQLKGGGRSAGREAPSRKSGYTAQIEDEPEYTPAKRSNRRNNKDRFDRSNNDREDREEFPSRRSATRELPEERFDQTAPRRRFAEPARTEVSSLARRQNDSWDEEDWNDPNRPVQIRRALPDADLATTQSGRRSISRDERPDWAEPDLDVASFEEPDANPRRRSRSDRGQDLASTSGESRQRPQTGRVARTTANYIDYEPLAKPLDARIDPPSGLPPAGPEPIVFPDRY